MRSSRAVFVNDARSPMQSKVDYMRLISSSSDISFYGAITAHANIKELIVRLTPNT